MKTLTILSLLAMAALSAVVFSGCETESANAPIYINPSAATVSGGESVTFTAEGGYDYKWSLSDTGLGYLSASTGPTTVYTAIGTNGQQTLTLTSTIAGADSGTSSNSVSYNQSTTTIINHI